MNDLPLCVKEAEIAMHVMNLVSITVLKLLKTYQVIPTFVLICDWLERLPNHSLRTLYVTLIEPYLKYCNTVLWQCSDTLTLNRPGGADSAHRLVLPSAVLKR